MFRRSTVRMVLLALGMAFAAAPAAAQVQRGSILVKVADGQGGVTPGVTVTLTSPILPGAIVGVTDSAGTYRSPSLGVGTYTVKLSLQGFQTLVRENVVVTQNQTVGLDLTLSVGAVSEQVTVVAESPVVDTKSTNVSVNIDKKILETTPGGKDIWSLLEYKAPGIVFDTPDVGGNQGGLQRALTARGTPNAQNTQLLNGVNVNDPAAQGFSMNYYVPTTFENIQVSTGSQDITVGTAGVVVNMVSKSGSNRFFFQNLLTCQGNCGPAKTQSRNVDAPLLNAGLRRDANGISYITNTNAQAGGPLLPNKLFYFGSVNYQPTHVNVVGFPAIAPSYIATPLANTSTEDTTDILAGEVKLNYQANGNNRFEGYLSKQRYDKPNRGANNLTTQESDSKELDTFVIAQTAWNLVLSDRIFADTRLSYNNTHFPLLQKTTLQPITDNTTNILYRNRTSSAMMFRRRLQVVSNWQYFLPKFLGGRHEFKGGIDNGYTPEDVTTTRVDDVNLTFTSSNGAPVRVTLFNSPTLLKRAVNTTALYGQDSYSYRRLTVIGGMRWERVEGFLPAQTRNQGRYFAPGTRFDSVTFSYTLPTGQAASVTEPYTVPDSHAAIRGNPLWKNFAGRFSATYDLFGKGRTIAKVSSGKYLDQIGTGTPPNPNGTISQQYAWNDLNGDYTFQPGTVTWNGTSYVGGTGSELGAFVSGTNAIANPYGPLTFNRSLKRPSRNEFTIGVDHELIPNLLIATTFIHRRERDNQGTVDQNPNLWPTNYTLVSLMEPGPDGVSGTADDTPISAYSLNPGTTITTVTVNDDRLAVRYNGIEIAMTKRFSKGWTALLGYDYGKTRQDLISLGNPNNVNVNAGGISGGRRHIFNGSASYVLPWYGILVGTQFRVQSGLPITRTWTPQVCSGTVTTNCLNQTQSLNVEPRGSRELPWLNSVDLRVGKVFKVRQHTFDLSVDAYNVTNANTVFSVGTASNTRNVRAGGDPNSPLVAIPNFMSPTGVLGPRIVRFNMTYSFSQ
jgi:Carboxypeptidase regulatory-like domain/TonB-dependent Receptor Plug Domain